MMSGMEFQNDLDKLLAVMPPKVISFITHESLSDVIEIVLDIGRVPEVRHSGGKIEKDPLPRGKRPGLYPSAQEIKPARHRPA